MALALGSDSDEAEGESCVCMELELWRQQSFEGEMRRELRLWWLFITILVLQLYNM